MRVDDVAPRTLLIGAFAGWAVVAWVLALAGMGGRLPRAPGGPVAGGPLPSLPEGAVAPAVGPFAQYAAIATRPLFAADRRPHPFSLVPAGGDASAAPEFDLVLTSVLITPQARIAIVQKPDGSDAWRVRVGEAPDGQPDWRLVDLQPRAAVFEGPGGRKELALRVFDGTGAATATPSPEPVVGGSPMPVPTPVAPASTPAPPATDAASIPDPAQIEQIRRRIEARREEMRRRASGTNPSAPVASPTPPANR